MKRPLQTWKKTIWSSAALRWRSRTGGDVGLKRALETDYDLFILDLMLPEMDGFEICKEIRNHKNTPIIMVPRKKTTSTKSVAWASEPTTI